MFVFIEAVRLNMKVFFRYKWVYMMTIIIQPVLMLVNVGLFSSIYSHNGTQTVKGYSLEQMIWYYTAAGFVFVFIWNQTQLRISHRIISGDLTVDLLRPIPLFNFEMADALAGRIVGVLFEFIPAVFFYSLIFFPSFITPLSVLRFSISITFSFMLYYIMSFLIGLVTFVIKNNNTVGAIKDLVITALGGVFIPLEFFPDSLNRVIDWLPFKYTFYWPIQFFLNRGEASDFKIFIRVILIQAVWCLFLYILCRLFWKAAVKKFCAAGG